jgi:exonuclease VII large subunit
VTTPAKVHSSDAIEAVRLALVMFVDRVTDALAELSSEMRRVQEWLEHDRPKHWKNQIRKAMDQAHEAQQALHRCLMFPIADERPSCYEERAELKKAKARLEYCQEKSERVRHWQQTMRHELFEYEGRMSQLMKLIEIDVPQAIGVLNRIARNLEEYHAVRAADPRSSYDDVAIVKAVWREEESPQAGDSGAADEVPAPGGRDKAEEIESKK